MEKKTMGAFLAALRKVNGYTQQEVADRLNVSNKTVSKWERDEGCPEIMMLPAIAELYEVTVDEILRGERIVREDTHFSKEKTEKQAKYLFAKAISRFNNFSVVAVALGIVSAVLSYLTGRVFYGYAETAGIIAVILIAAASVITEIIAFNNFKLNFNAEDNIVDEKELNNGKRKSLTMLAIVVCLAVISMVITVSIIALDIDIEVMTPVGVLLGLITAFVIYLIGGKNIGLKNVYSAELIKYRSKHILVTSIIIAVVMVISVVFPFVDEYIDYQTIQTYSFSEAADYGLVSSAENEYNSWNKEYNYLSYALDDLLEAVIVASIISICICSASYLIYCGKKRKFIHT